MRKFLVCLGTHELSKFLMLFVSKEGEPDCQLLKPFGQLMVTFSRRNIGNVRSQRALVASGSPHHMICSVSLTHNRTYWSSLRIE